MTTRREFIKSAAWASAGLAVGGFSTKTSAASYSRIAGANKKRELGIYWYRKQGMGNYE